MKSVNKVIVVGRMGKDPELKVTASGRDVVSFSVATTDKWTDKQTGQPQEKTEWHQCGAFDKLAGIIGQYGAKGQIVYVEGSNRTRRWQSQSGEDHYTTSVVVTEFNILHDPNYQGSNANAHPAPEQPSRTNPNGTARSPYANNAQPPPPPAFDGNEDDDIPF